MSTPVGLVARCAHSGDGLSASTIQWGQRGAASPPVGLTDRDLTLFALVFDANYLSASQLVVLGWGETGERAGQRRLKLLHDAGYLDRFRPVAGVGSAEWNYRLSARGWQALEDRHRAPIAHYKPSAISSIGYTEHDLQVAAIVLRLARAASGDSSRALIERMPFSWRGARTGRIDPPRGRVAEPSEPDPGVRLHAEGSRLGYLEPDATLVAERGPDSFAVLIEYDRTERPHKQVDRLRRYDRWFLSGWRASEYGRHAIAPAVLFLTAHETPLRRLVETADSTLSAWRAGPSAGPREGVHPARQRIVFSSRERLVDGDWTMLRTPSLPPALRDESDVCIPRTLTYDLPALLSAAA
jgi:hypothetical protein